MSHPTKISPCPIHSAVAEIRFSTQHQYDEIFAKVHAVFSKEFPHLERLDILQLPEDIRSSDPNLKNVPYHRFREEHYSLLVGPSTFAIVVTPEYRGWTEFKTKACAAFDKFKELDMVDSYQRYSLRYTDFFGNNDIFSNIDLTFGLNERPFHGPETSFRTLLDWKNYNHILKVNNHSTLGKASGSIIDTDTICIPLDGLLPDNLEDAYNCMHESSKDLFFSLLKDDFIETMSPEYD